MAKIIVVKNNNTGQVYQINEQSWANLEKMDMHTLYSVVDTREVGSERKPFIPAEVSSKGILVEKNKVEEKEKN